MKIQLNQIYTINGERLKCTRMRASGLHTFRLIDQDNNLVEIRAEHNKGIILDYGIRLYKFK